MVGCMARSRLLTFVLATCLLAILIQEGSLVTDTRNVAVAVLAHGAVGAAASGVGSGLLGADEFDPLVGISETPADSSVLPAATAAAKAISAAAAAPQPLSSLAAAAAAAAVPAAAVPATAAVRTAPVAYSSELRPSAGATGKSCPTGCEVHGTCNRELGVCECMPLMGGPACDVGLVPSCRKLWGLDVPIPPCQALALEAFDYLDFPPSCECLAECQALNVRVVYVDKCVNATGDVYQPSQLGWPPKDGPPAKFPWKDMFGDGKWMRQAYFVGRKDTPVPDEETLRKNVALAARLSADGAASVAGKLCSGRGLYTEVMPWANPGKFVGKYCHCLPGWYGDACDKGPADVAAPTVKSFCVHRCSGRGHCKLNVCHCVPGTWGVDCGLGTPNAALAQAAEAEQRRLGLGMPLGWPPAMVPAPAPLGPPFDSLFHGRFDHPFLQSLPPPLPPPLPQPRIHS